MIDEKNMVISTEVGKIPEKEKVNYVRYIFPILITLVVVVLLSFCEYLNTEHKNYMNSFITRKVLINGNPLQITSWDANTFILKNGVLAERNFVENNLIFDSIIFIER